jgi:Histidine kinase
MARDCRQPPACHPSRRLSIRRQPRGSAAHGFLHCRAMSTLTFDTIRQGWKSWYGNDLEPVGPAWLQWALTGVFCLVVALCFTMIGFAINAMGGGSAWSRPSAWLHWYGKNLQVSLIIGYFIHILFAILIPLVGRARIRAWSNGRQAFFFSAIPISGVALAWPLGVWLTQGTGSWMERAGAGTVVGMLLFGTVTSFIFFQIFSAKAQQAEAEKRATEAQLRLLQAQMEPHFLFNTLANVLTLIDAEPPRAKAMLESFTDYLRATLQNLRSGDSNVGRELDLAEAYLKLLQLRMEDRLAYRIDADPALRSAALPPLLLQPLVENAVHHGLEPKVEGGRVTIAVQRRGSDLVLSVSDDGLGTEAPQRRSTGNGVALDNIRARLLAQHGSGATLALEPLAPGTRATLTLPFTESAR